MSPAKVPALAGVAEIAAIAGVTRQRAQQISQQKGFPDPVLVLKMGPVWRQSDVEDYITAWRDKQKARGRRQGTPPQGRQPQQPGSLQLGTPGAAAMSTDKGHSEPHTLSDGRCYCTCAACSDENGAASARSARTYPSTRTAPSIPWGHHDRHRGGRSRHHRHPDRPLPPGPPQRAEAGEPDLRLHPSPLVPRRPDGACGWEGSHYIGESKHGISQYEPRYCSCKQYSGPVPMPEYYAPELASGEKP